MNRPILLASVATAAVPFSPAIAAPAPGPAIDQTAPNAATDAPAATRAPKGGAGGITITGRRLDVARDAIAPSLGASQYTFDKEALEKQPGGTNLTLNKSLLQAPGVVQDSYGVIHVRNEHGNLQYRLNGVIVPESISGFGTTFDPRIASSIQLITGTLPAQYGYRTSGVINFRTQSGLLGSGGEVGVYGGSFGWFEPSAMIQGSSGNFSYFASGSYLGNNLGIENPEPTKHAIHDRTTQIRPFAYLSDILSESSRISLFGGSFIGKFQIPNVHGEEPGFTVNGVSDFDSTKLDQNQKEITHYGVVAYQYAGNGFNAQVAPFVRYTETRFTPDPNHGDIIFNGFADAARLTGLAAGVQADDSEQLGSSHTLRFGVFFQNERTTSKVTSTVLPVDCSISADPACEPAQTSDVPLTIVDRSNKTGQLYGAYLQDEWKLSPTLTLNYGARFDVVRAFTHESQLSPRANLVWQATPRTTVHIGYARNFTPPPQELISLRDVALFNFTTKESEIQQADPVKAEREHYFDAGVEQRFKGGFKLAVDAYYKRKKTCSMRASSVPRSSSRRSTMPRVMPGASSSAGTTRMGRSTSTPTSPAARRRANTSSRPNTSSRRTSSPTSRTTTSSPTIRRNGRRRAVAATRSTTASAPWCRRWTSSTRRASGPTTRTGLCRTAVPCRLTGCSTPESRRISTDRECSRA